MKKIIICIIIILFFGNLGANSIDKTSEYQTDATTDNSVSSDKNKKSVNNDSGIKFRGEVFFGYIYMPEYHDGIMPVNRFSIPNSNAIDYTDSGDPGNKHHSGNGRIIGGTNGAHLFGIFGKYSFIFPFMAIDRPLMKNNNIKFSVIGQITPVTWDSGFSMTITPIAFFQFEMGMLIGCGWTLTNTIGGLGINDKGVIKRYSAGGPYLQLWFAPLFQIDIAYLLPQAYQRWTHIVAVANPKFKYDALLSVKEDQPWMYQEDPGERLNGWQFQGEFYFGYRFYINEEDTGENQRFLKKVHKNFIITPVMYIWIENFHLTHYYDSLMKDGGWGSDFVNVNFGPAVLINLPMNFFFKAAFLFCNDKAYTSSTAGNLFYQDREYSDWYVYARWYRMSFGWNF